MRRLLILSAAAVLIWSFQAGAAFAARLALVIGNGAYENVPVLPNPARDAAGVARALRGIGFEVVDRTDLDGAQMRSAVLSFARRVSAERPEAAMIYYAGHGIELGGSNYLIPTDARLETDLMVEDEAINLRSLLNAVSGAKGLGVVVLDACRDNPFSNRMRSVAGLTRSVSRGLARTADILSPHLMVAYAAQDGALASDGDTGGHSPYAQALIEALEGEALAADRLFGKVKERVQELTGGRQEPWQYNNFGFRVPSLHAAPVERPTPPPADPCALVRLSGDARCRVDEEGMAVLETTTAPGSGPAPVREAALSGVDPEQLKLCEEIPLLSDVGGSLERMDRLINELRNQLQIKERREVYLSACRGVVKDAPELWRPGARLGLLQIALGQREEGWRMIMQATKSGDVEARSDLVFPIYVAETLLSLNNSSNSEMLADDMKPQVADWARQAAQSGDSASMVFLALFLAEGWGVRENEGQALFWVRKAAGLGQVPAMVLLGGAYEAGEIGLPSNPAQARAWYEKALAAAETPELQSEVRRALERLEPAN